MGSGGKTQDVAGNDLGEGVIGYSGGQGSDAQVVDRGGGGGGAGGAGQASNANTGGDGGIPWLTESHSANWIVTTTGIVDGTGTTAFSRGGDGGGSNAPENGTPGANYGDGGSAGKSANSTDAKGHDGIVIIRFLRPGE
jgi:hypothetical protein